MILLEFTGINTKNVDHHNRCPPDSLVIVKCLKNVITEESLVHLGARLPMSNRRVKLGKRLYHGESVFCYPPEGYAILEDLPTIRCANCRFTEISRIDTFNDRRVSPIGGVATYKLNCNPEDQMEAKIENYFCSRAIEGQPELSYTSREEIHGDSGK
jgi:hypothetical protein